MLEKQNLLNEQLAQGKKPLTLPGTLAGQPGGRPDTANFGLGAPEMMQPRNKSKQVTPKGQANIRERSKFKNKLAAPKQGRVLEV